MTKYNLQLMQINNIFNNGFSFRKHPFLLDNFKLRLRFIVSPDVPHSY